MSAAVNTTQAEQWNGAEGRHWAAEHERYHAMQEPFGARALDAAAIQPAERVLDVGCGAGDMVLGAAQLTGPAGQVVGVDLSMPLVEAARRRAADAGLGNVTIVAGDAQTQPLGEGELDVVTSRFGVMFFDDPVAAFTNIARALRPGGRLSFVCWQDVAVNEWMMVPPMAALAHVPPPDPVLFEATSPFGLADAGRVTEILHQAGFVDVALTSIEQPMLFGGGGTVEDAVDFFRDGSFGAVLLAGAGPEEIAKALAAVTEAFEAHLTPRGVELGAAAWLVTANVPWTCPVTSPGSAT